MLENTGVLFAYLIAQKDDEIDFISVQGVNSLQCLLKDFPKHIKIMRNDADVAGKDALFEIFCVIGRKHQTDIFMSLMEKISDELFKYILADSDFDYQAYIVQNLTEQEQKFTVMDHAAWLIMYQTLCCDWVYDMRQFAITGDDEKLEVCCLGLGAKLEDQQLMWMQSAVEIWMNYEAPQFLGKQVVINSFLLEDLKGRRIIGALPQNDNSGYYLLIEGGRKLLLKSGFAEYMNEQIGYRDINIYSINDINTILSNPIYSYGIYFQPYELFDTWQRVFQYAIVILDVEWTTETLQKVYELFMDFMGNQICECIEAPTMLSKDMFFDAYLKRIAKMREYLQCEEDVIISNDWLRIVGNRFVYLNKIYSLLGQLYSKEISEMGKTKTFDLSEFRQLLAASEKGTAFQKGIMWENVAAYMMDRIVGLKVSGKRLRVARQEIDLCCVNVSVEEELWKLGALILVECKNWKRKADVSIIRGIGQIMYIKGVTTTLLFSKLGVTSDAEAEILQLALRGEHVLCITQIDLFNIVEKQDFYKLLIRKWIELEQTIENDYGLLG